MKRAFFYLPCILLIVVALSQILITQRQGFLTPAKGGGFGMFSTVDKLNNRVISVYGLFGEKKVKIRIDPSDPSFQKNFDKKWQRARAYPSDEHLLALGKALGNLKLSQTPTHLFIEVKKCHFDSEKAVVDYQQVNSLSVPFRKSK